MIGIFTRWRLEKFRGEPQHPFRFVRGHQLIYERLEIREDLDLRESFCFDLIQRQPRRVLVTIRSNAPTSEFCTTPAVSTMTTDVTQMSESG
jgi:hypothetical protein